jgi:creatinine amidohydrolase
VIEWTTLTSEEVDRLDRELPVVIPIGLVEAHGPALTLGLDIDTADHFARKVCEATGAILLPTIPYGYADQNREYPGTVGLTPETLGAMVADVCEAICLHGFRKVIFISGHGANNKGVELGFERAWRRYPDLKPACWAWWAPAGLPMHHADKAETEFAILTGSPVYLDRARDFAFQKPWHQVRSRHAFQPESGGVNGTPSQADPKASEADYQRALKALIANVEQAKSDRRQPAGG